VGLGKSAEVSGAIHKATEWPTFNGESILARGTIPHQVEGIFGATRVVLKPATPGTGVIAGAASGPCSKQRDSRRSYEGARFAKSAQRRSGDHQRAFDAEDP